MHGCFIEDDGATALAGAIKVHPRICVIDVGENNFGDLAIEKFSEASNQSVSLEEIHLGGHQVLRSQGGHAIGNMLKGSNNLKKLPLKIQAVEELCSSVHGGESYIRDGRYCVSHLSTLPELMISCARG